MPTDSQHDAFAQALRRFKKVVENPLSSRRQLVQTANKLLRTRVAQRAFHFETLEERITGLLPKLSVNAITRELELGPQKVNTRVLLTALGIAPSRGLETRLGLILQSWGYSKVRRSDGHRYLAP